MADNRHHISNRALHTCMVIAVLVMAAMTSCFQNTTYYHYHSTNVEGWERFDFLEYQMPPVATSGYYVEEIGLRTNSQYPFSQITLVVNQCVVSTTNRTPGKYKSDTIVVDVYDQQGHPLGDGVAVRTHVIPFKSLKLQTGDSLSVKIKHDMRQTTLPGVAGVGLKVTRQYDE